MITPVYKDYPDVTFERKGIGKKEKQFRIPLIEIYIYIEWIDEILHTS